MFQRILKTNRKAIVVLISLMTIFIIGVLFNTFYNYDILTVNMKEEGIPVPIIMYHSIYNGREKSNDYIVSSDLFRRDMNYLKENGYTTIFISDLIEYVYNDKELPEKPVIITLDDGYLNNLVYVIPILQELDMKAVISVIGTNTQQFSDVEDKNLSYAHMSWDEIKEAVATGRVEIGNHTYDMHQSKSRRGSMKKKGESIEQYKTSFMSDVGKLQTELKENVGITPYVFTYPYGAISEESLPIIKEMGFKAALTCYGKVNMITKDTEKLYSLDRFNRNPKLSTNDFMKKIQ